MDAKTDHSARWYVPSSQPQRRMFGKRVWTVVAMILVLPLFCRFPGGLPGGGKESCARHACKHMTDTYDFDWYKLKPSENIEWTPCYDAQKCARLTLPLDYEYPAGPKTHIALRMVPAADSANYKGAVLYNPGGPVSGATGSTFLGKELATLVGLDYDLVGFDPRGTGASVPLAQCFDSDSQFGIWKLQERPINITNYDSVIYGQARARLLAERCAGALGGNSTAEDVGATTEEWGPGRFLSTMSVVEDIVRISQALGQEEVNWIGFSYGTMIAQYFAAMYPDKVGRFVIDGVHDAAEYRSSASVDSGLQDSNKIVEAFYMFCSRAGPEKCDVAEPTAELTKERVLKIRQNLATNPIPIPSAKHGPAVITIDALDAFIFLSTFRPVSEFPKLANSLLAIERHSMSALENIIDTLEVPAFECSRSIQHPWAVPNQANPAILCTDKDIVPNSVDDFISYVKALSNISIYAASSWADGYLMCAEWKMRAKARYTGPFAANTTNTMLIVSTSWDRVCPLAHAQAVHARYPNSRLLQTTGYGHCSVAAPSMCAGRAIHAFFANGTLPEDGTICDVDELPFISEVNSTASLISNTDKQLWSTLKELSRANVGTRTIQVGF